MGPSTPDRPPAVLLVIKLPTGNVHLMEFGVQPFRQHTGTVGVHVEPVFVASDGLVDAAFVALALIVSLEKTKTELFRRFCGAIFALSSLILPRND